MNSTELVPTNPAPARQPVVEFIRGQRQNAAYVFLGLSVLCLIGTIWLAVRAFKTPVAADKTEEKKSLDEEKPPTPELPKAEVANLNRSSYMVGWIGGLAATLITASVGIFLQVMPPKPTPEKQQREARVLVLTAGGLLGAALILFGGFFFYLWSDSLTGWLDKGEKKEMVWVVVPLLMVAGGAGLVFAAVQPARAEERNDHTIRRLVYGSNFAVTVLLLFVMLIVVNVVVAMKVPNKLDTTETGFYTLSDSTKSFLGKLTEPATLYVILPDSGGREANDIKQFAYTAQEASDGKLSLKFVSPVTNKQELAKLQDKYSRIGRDPANRDAYGLLLTIGEDEKRHTFIPFRDLFDLNPRTQEVQGFAGEAKLIREFRFLADNEQRPVIYFTQSNGELSIGNPAAGAEMLNIGPTANLLKTYLERNYVDVRPMTFAPKDPAVPADATAVVIADPQSPLSAPAVDALRKYMTARKGKLIVLTSANPAPNDKGMQKTGLEGFLKEFNVSLGEKFLYTYSPDLPDHRLAIALYNPRLQNPIAQSLGKAGRGFIVPTPREVTPITGGNPQVQASPLILSAGGRMTWLEDNPVPPSGVDRILTDLENNEQVRVRKNLSDRSRPLAVVVSEGDGNPHGGSAGTAGRLIVIGYSALFADHIAEKTRSTGFDVIGLGIDWLRDRPLGMTDAESKKYKEYMPPEPSTVSNLRLVFMPVGLAMMLIIGLGTGVWVMRRK